MKLQVKEAQKELPNQAKVGTAAAGRRVSAALKCPAAAETTVPATATGATPKVAAAAKRLLRRPSSLALVKGEHAAKREGAEAVAGAAAASGVASVGGDVGSTAGASASADGEQPGRGGGGGGAACKQAPNAAARPAKRTKPTQNAVKAEPEVSTQLDIPEMSFVEDAMDVDRMNGVTQNPHISESD